MLKRPILAVAVCSALASIGCGPPYHMEAVAMPSPFVRPDCRAMLEPIHTDRLMVGGKPEAMHVAEKKESSADSYENDKGVADGIFHQRIAAEHGSLFIPGGAPENTFTIRAEWVHWEPGFIMGHNPSVANLVVDVLSPNGQLLDRFDFETVVGASLFNPSSGGRMKSAFDKAGKIVSDYISDRWLCAGH